MESNHLQNETLQESPSGSPLQDDQIHLLVLDDEKAIADLVVSIFEAEGMRANAFYHPIDALKALEAVHYDLAIVDVMMPSMDGFEFCRQIRSNSDIPVVFLSAKDQEVDVVTGLTLGADDYVTKPFKPRELVARVKAHLRRHALARSGQARPGSEGSSLQVRGLFLDPRAHKANLHDIELQLTPKEFEILELLMRRAGEPVSAKELYEHAWKEEANSSSANTVMVHIRHLRKKLADIDSSEQFIETAWGVGYKIPE